jgi:hypothetical protein
MIDKAGEDAMSRSIVLLLVVCVCAGRLAAQDLSDIQIHGFATQGFLFSSNNNYLSLKSSSGSLQWTEGAISVTDPVTDKLRIGIQLHMQQMGNFGGSKVVVDWASGDYKFNDKIGIRAGKIKRPFGLFNDSQDVDPLFLWILLPPGMYPIDNRDFDLAEMEGEIYGVVTLGRRGGYLQYRGHVGGNNLDANGGYDQNMAEVGLTFTSPPSGKAYGFDARWTTSWRELTVGASALSEGLDGTARRELRICPHRFLLPTTPDGTKGGSTWRENTGELLSIFP